MSLTLEHGMVRWIETRGIEIVRGIYGAVRDPDWETIEPRYSSFEVALGVDTFEVRFQADCIRESDGVDVGWAGTVSGDRHGTVRFTFDGLVRRSFDAARIGLCVLHPPRLAGALIEVETLFGTQRGRFPDLVTGYLPYSNITRISHDIGESYEARIDFAGDVFQMEDQRAFTDASFKTFSRPLELPRPYRLDAGSSVLQTVTVAVPRAGSSKRVASKALTRGPEVVRLGAGTGRAFPTVGSVVSPRDVDTTAQVAEAVRALGLAHVRATVDVGAPDALTQVADAVAAAIEVATDLELVLVADPADPALDEILRRCGASGVGLARVIAVDPRRHTTPPALAMRVRDAMRAAAIAAPLYGGSRAYLYQLVDQGIRADLVDGVAYPVSPQVHAFDETSIMENVEALPVTVRTAAALVAGKPVAVGPVSLRALLNPDRQGPEPAPPPGSLPARYDRRQPNVFTAAWTLAAAGALAAGGAASMTLHETAGWGGLVAAAHAGLPAMPAGAGTVLPSGRVVAAIVGLSGADMLTATSSPWLAVLAVSRAAGGPDVLVANLQARERLVTIEPAQGRVGPGHLLTVLPDGSATWERSGLRTGRVELPPFGIAMLTSRPEWPLGTPAGDGVRRPLRPPRSGQIM